MKKVTAKVRTSASHSRAAKAGSRPKAKAGKEQTAATPVDPAFQQVVAAPAKDPQVGVGRMVSSNSVLNVKGKIFAMFGLLVLGALWQLPFTPT